MTLAPALAARFYEHFHRAPELAARAPGRVNLIGEHTDYNHGLVLPCAIDRDTTVVAARRSDDRVRVLAADLEQSAEFGSQQLSRRGDWLDYVQAVLWSLQQDGLATAGLDLLISSDVPREAGLSSSAALGVALATVFDAASDLSLDAIALARIVHRGESEFVGVGCGILDQFASALGQRDHVLRIDCRDQSVRAVPLHGDRLRIVLADSGVRRALAKAGTGYLARVAECRSALDSAIAAGIARSDAPTLRELSVDDLPRLERALDPLSYRRTRHTITENERVDAVCAELSAQSPDAEQVGAHIRAGQASLRDDFEVSIPELDLLCEIGDALPGVFGSRLTGAGFGGWTLHLVAAEAAEQVATQLSREFAQRMGRQAAVRIVAPSQGATQLEIA